MKTESILYIHAMLRGNAYAKKQELQKAEAACYGKKTVAADKLTERDLARERFERACRVLEDFREEDW